MTKNISCHIQVDLSFTFLPHAFVTTGQKGSCFLTFCSLSELCAVLSLCSAGVSTCKKCTFVSWLKGG